jgi:RimJ/RimL family protein N-acetyltransferase
MKELMLRHAFQFVENVIFLIDHENIRSQRSVEKIGAMRVGTRRGPMTGREPVVYRITSAAFRRED